jgi:hypothetical protein
VARSLTGACQAAHGEREAAEESLLRSLEELRVQGGVKAVHKKQTLARLVELYEAWDRPEEVNKYGQLLAAEEAGS